MRFERGVVDAQSREVPWDEVRERRVLVGVRRGGTTTRRTGSAAPRRAAWAFGGVAAAAAMVAVLSHGIEPAPRTEPAPVVGVEQPSAAPADDPSVLRLADGSRATLSPGAAVDVALQTETAVRLTQRAGHVRYEVMPNADRSLAVDAAGVIVRVVGTVFTVDVSPAAVAVAVERGVVEVDDGDGESRLVAGRTLTVTLPVTVPATDGQPEPGDRAPAADRAGAPRPAVARRRTLDRPAPPFDALLEQADAARANRDWSRAATLLREVAKLHANDPRSSSALFTLGRVERSRKRHAAAAEAFRSCWQRWPRGPLAEDARAEHATSLADAGQVDDARAAAGEYLARHRSGTHARRMQAIMDAR